MELLHLIFDNVIFDGIVVVTLFNIYPLEFNVDDSYIQQRRSLRSSSGSSPGDSSSRPIKCPSAWHFNNGADVPSHLLGHSVLCVDISSNSDIVTNGISTSMVSSLRETVPVPMPILPFYILFNFYLISLKINYKFEFYTKFEYCTMFEFYTKFEFNSKFELYTKFEL